MGLEKISYEDKVKDSPGVSETVERFQNLQNDEFDAFTSNHDTSGIHTDILLPKGRARVDFAAGVPSLTYSTGLITGVTDVSPGVTTVTLSSAANTLLSMSATATAFHVVPETLSFYTVVVAATADKQGFTVATFSLNSLSFTDVTFTITIWVD